MTLNDSIIHVFCRFGNGFCSQYTFQMRWGNASLPVIAAGSSNAVSHDRDFAPPLDVAGCIRHLGLLSPAGRSDLVLCVGQRLSALSSIGAFESRSGD